MEHLSTGRPRIGIVGISGYARVYLDLLLAEKNRSRIDFAAAAVVPQDQALPVVSVLRALGVRIYDSFEHFIEGERGRLDLCIVPTGIHWHARMTIAALQADFNVLVEKPLAGSREDAQAVVGAEQRSKRWVAVGFQDIYTEEAAWMKKAILAGKIGKVVSARMVGLWPRPRAYYTRNKWAGRMYADGAAALDSPLNNGLAHFANLSIFFLGKEPWGGTRLMIEDAELFRANPIESFDTAVVRGHSAEGASFWFGVTHACRELREPEVVVQGTQGRAIWRHEVECVIESGDGETSVRKAPDYETARQRMLDAVLARLDDQDAPICGTDLAMHHTCFIDSLHALSPIQHLTQPVVEQVAVGSEEFTAIRNIESLLERGFSTATMLKESGFKGSMVNLRQG